MTIENKPTEDPSTKKPSIKELFIATIVATGDPTAPFKIQDAHAAAERIGKLLIRAPGANVEATCAYSERLLKNFPEDMATIGRDPNFVIALASVFAISLVRWTAEAAKEVRINEGKVNED